MEFDLIHHIRQLASSHGRDDVVCGIGDDAAILDVPPGQQLVVSIDTLVEGVHFLPHTPAEKLGWKALAVNLSDLAAMGAAPAWCVLALTLPRADDAFVTAFMQGFMALARKHRVALVGGDTTQGPLAISVTVHGLVPAGKSLRRNGARVGDDVYVTGPVGDAAAALHCLEDTRADAQALRHKLELPVPQVEAGQILRDYAHAAIDISDGLLAEVTHICEESGTGADLQIDAVPVSNELTSLFAPDAVRNFALTGGDAYQLCYTLPPAQANAAAKALAAVHVYPSRVGCITAEKGIRVYTAKGDKMQVTGHSWEHFQT